jgi:hypothetical protein
MKIDSYSFGHLSVDGRAYTSDVIIYPDRVDASWWRQQGHLLQVADLAEVFKDPPEVLIVGTGAHGVMKVAHEVELKAAELGVRLVVQRSYEACEEFNRLAASRKTIACLHLTC